MKLHIIPRIRGRFKLFYNKHIKKINSAIEIFGMSLMISLPVGLILNNYNLYIFFASVGIYFVYKEIVQDLKIIIPRGR